MQSWSEITHYAGFDWATDHHDVIIVNRSGKIVADFQIEHTAEGWQRWLEQVAALGSGLAACVETSQGFCRRTTPKRGNIIVSRVLRIDQAEGVRGIMGFFARWISIALGLC